MMKELIAIEKSQIRKVPELRPGDTVKVHNKIVEGNKERVQIFEGVVLRVSGGGLKTSFTVRKISYGVGVERVFLLHSPKISKIQIVKRAKVRQAYLTYLRALRGKKAKLTEKQFDTLAVNVKEEELKPEDLAPPSKDEEEKENLDEEITELDKEELQDAESDLSVEDIAQAEIEGDESTSRGSEIEDEQELPAEEVSEGLAEAEEDIEKGKSREGKRAEKSIEDIDNDNHGPKI